MKNKTTVMPGLVLLLATTLFAENDGLHVYGPVPGLAPSEFYGFRVREVGATEWLDPFAFITRCQRGGETNHYYEDLEDWSNTYINFEMSNSVPVEIEISKVSGAPITNAVPHPAHKVNSCAVVGGKAYVVIDDPALFTVDIDGQMDEQDTSRISPTGWGADSFYSGPPIHTLTVFANPFLQDKPATNDPNVYVVQTNSVPPETGTWDTLYFLPGVHDIGRSFRVHEYKNYYIPGDAIVYGTFNNNKDWNDGDNILIFGHGTLSGERVPHPDDDTPPAPDEDDWLYKPIDIAGASDTTVEGITIADSAMHSLMLVNSYDPANPTDIRWVKIFTWRSNGDGINPFGNGLIEDCFIRAADDCTYVNGRGIRRCVFWTDVNGSAFTMTPIGGIANPDLVVEDCDIIYNRSRFTEGANGGRVFNMRGTGSGEGGTNVTFRNIRVSDPRPTRSCFAIQTASSYTDYPNYESIRGDGDIVGIRFENISIAAPSILGYPETLWGNTNALIRDCIFENVTLAGVPFDDIDDFNHNEYVTNLTFIVTDPYSTGLLVDTFEDGNIATATSAGDTLGGFDIAGDLLDPEINVLETNGNAVLDLEGATNDFPYVAMMSKTSFNGAAQDALSLSFEVKSLSGSWWYLRPFVINFRPNASTDAQIYDRGNKAPPLGLSLMVGNQDSANCRVALVAYDGTTENWLWEDLEVTHAELADGFAATITVDRTNGWQLAFTGAASLPASVSGSWGTLGWSDIFNSTTYVQCYLREDNLSGKVPPRVGKARAEIASIAVATNGSMTPYDAWAGLWGGTDLSNPMDDYDNDGLPNFGEYALNGNPTNAGDTGQVEINADSDWFTFVHTSNVVDSSLVYRLLDRTNLVSGAVNTNNWDLQTIGPGVDDYSAVSNHYSATGEDRLFIQLQIGQE